MHLTSPLLDFPQLHLSLAKALAGLGEGRLVSGAVRRVVPALAVVRARRLAAGQGSSGHLRSLITVAKLGLPVLLALTKPLQHPLDLPLRPAQGFLCVATEAAQRALQVFES